MEKQKSLVPAALRAAADLMISGGYVKGMLTDNEGAHCALGAIYAVSGGVSPQIIEALADMITDRIPEQGIYDRYNKNHVTKNSGDLSKIASWNNVICDSAEDVACMMRATAELLEEDALLEPEV